MSSESGSGENLLGGESGFPECIVAGGLGGAEKFMRRLRALALSSLGRMFDRRERLFHFRVRKTNGAIVPEGHSRRYTAITLIGLAKEGRDAAREVLGGLAPEDVFAGLLGSLDGNTNVGDVALFLWAGTALGHDGAMRALRRLVELGPQRMPCPTVELSWALIALCKARESVDCGLREAVAARLLEAFRSRSGLFSHVVGGRQGFLRSHVCCFADLVYPVQALSEYARQTKEQVFLETAQACAERFCALQGPQGQWWWHYDTRTGAVVENYPVYAVHQDAMAPMALFALARAGGRLFAEEIRRGVEWLSCAPELNGGSLMDEGAGIVWRKVGRAEPAKLSRVLQAAAARLAPGLRVPGVNRVFPPRQVDYEDRPYHVGWLLYAWSRAGAVEGKVGSVSQ